MKKVFYFLLAVSVVFVFSCKKTAAPTSPVPKISFGGFTTSNGSNAVFTLNFTDNDGDIGYEPADQNNTNYDLYIRYYYKNYQGKYVPFYLRDPTQPADPIRDSTIYPYHIPYIDDNIKSKILDGQIIIDMPNGYKPITFYNDSLSNFRYTFWIYDRAGHKSNVDTTPVFQTPY